MKSAKSSIASLERTLSRFLNTVKCVRLIKINKAQLLLSLLRLSVV
jgi:hypothetical protein